MGAYKDFAITLKQLEDDGWLEGVLLADGYDEAFIGIGTLFSHAVAVYDYEECIRVLVDRDGMSQEEAEEYFEFNTAGSYVGNATPVFIRKWVSHFSHRQND